MCSLPISQYFALEKCILLIARLITCTSLWPHLVGVCMYPFTMPTAGAQSSINIRVLARVIYLQKKKKNNNNNKVQITWSDPP